MIGNCVGLGGREGGDLPEEPERGGWGGKEFPNTDGQNTPTDIEMP